MAARTKLEPPLNPDLASVRQRLQARAQELRSQLEPANAEAADADDAGGREVRDLGDQAAERSRERLGDARRDRHRDDLLRVLDALHRLDDGSYGTCLDCGAAIERSRLEALPAAERCAGCQTHRERDGQDGFIVLDAMHRETLLNLDDLATMVESLADKGVTAQSRVRSGRLLRHLGTASRRHHEDEERHVFPPLLKSGKPELVQTVLRLQQDHFWIEEDWRALEPQLAAIAAGEASFDLEALRSGVQALTALHRDHIALEESVIYPQAFSRLGLRARREMGREMAQRRRAAAGGHQAPVVR